MNKKLLFALLIILNLYLLVGCNTLNILQRETTTTTTTTSTTISTTSTTTVASTSTSLTATSTTTLSTAITSTTSTTTTTITKYISYGGITLETTIPEVKAAWGNPIYTTIEAENSYLRYMWGLPPLVTTYAVDFLSEEGTYVVVCIWDFTNFATWLGVSKNDPKAVVQSLWGTPTGVETTESYEYWVYPNNLGVAYDLSTSKVIGLLLMDFDKTKWAQNSTVTSTTTTTTITQPETSTTSTIASTTTTGTTTTTTTIVEVLSVPTGLIANYETTYLSTYFRIILQWDPNPEANINAYYIYKSTSQEGNYTYQSSVEGSSTGAYDYVYMTGNYAKYFYYKIKAINSGGQASEFSDVASCPTPPTTPTGLTVEDVGIVVSLTWNENPESNVTGYSVYRKIGFGDYTKITSDPTIETNYSHSITQTAWHYYKITAIVEESESGYSGEQSIYATTY